jgi:hypothetical protein
MKITQGLLSTAEVKKFAPQYVKFVGGDFDEWDPIFKQFKTLKVGNHAVTYVAGKFVAVRVTSIRHNDIRAVDGPVVRVSNGEYTWRVDGDNYAYPLV